MPPLVRKTLRDFRRTLIGWTVGACAFLSLYMALYPTIAKDPVFYSQVAVAKYPGVLKDLIGIDGSITGASFVQLIAYQFFGSVLFIMCAVALGNRAIAVPEESGFLELMITLPIDRRRLVLERVAALALGLLAILGAILVVILTLNGVAGIGADPGNIVAAHTGLFLLALFYGVLTLAVGAATGSRSLALSVSGTYAVAAYLVATIGKNVGVIAWARYISPFHYYLDGRPVFLGWPVGYYLILAGATAVLVVAAVLSFDRRDVGV